MIDYGKELQKAYDEGYEARDSEIVRCRECKYYINGYCYSDNFVLRFEEVKSDWFCADGERKEQNDDI